MTWALTVLSERQKLHGQRNWTCFYYLEVISPGQDKVQLHDLVVPFLVLINTIRLNLENNYRESQKSRVRSIVYCWTALLLFVLLLHTQNSKLPESYSPQNGKLHPLRIVFQYQEVLQNYRCNTAMLQWWGVTKKCIMLLFALGMGTQ